MEDVPDPIPLSALQHWQYCPRQCGLIHLEQVFDDNVHTLRGQAVHAKADQPGVESAKGVRLETGRQAEILNSITRFLRSGNSKIELPEEELKELVGHTPFQVAVGSAIGIIVGLLIH